MSVLLDTGFLFAFLDEGDTKHDEAFALMDRIQAKEFGAPFVSDLVIVELFSLIRARKRAARMEEAARRLLPLPSPALRGLSLVSLGPSIFERAWEEFDRYRDQRISFTDASLIATLAELRIDALATFDEVLCNLTPTAA
jgi:predicted nucleic acid-binding protein